MHIRSFMMGSTVEAPLAKPVLQGLMAWVLSQTFRIRLIRIPDMRVRRHLVGRGGAANMRVSDHAARGETRCGRGSEKRKAELQVIASDACEKARWR